MFQRINTTIRGCNDTLLEIVYKIFGVLFYLSRHTSLYYLNNCVRINNNVYCVSQVARVHLLAKFQLQ